MLNLSSLVTQKHDEQLKQYTSEDSSAKSTQVTK
jgi:hypothetical protein